MTKADREARRVEVLRSRAARLAAGKMGGADARQIALEVALVAVGAERFGLPVAGLREILPLPKVARLPGMPPWMLGIAQVRGELVSVVDLGEWLGIEAGGKPTHLVLAEGEAGPIGLTADQVLGFRYVYSDELADADAAQRAKRPVTAITRDLVTVIDLDRLVRSDGLMVP